MRRLPPISAALDETILEVFGKPNDPMTLVEARADRAFEGRSPVVWEGDAATFHFSFVSRGAERVLGYPANRWVTEPTFWADIVVHEEDRADAIAYCALATGRGRDHRFDYRARAADGRIVWLRDFVQVIVGRRGVPERLRGIMFDISEEIGRQASSVRPSKGSQLPSQEELSAVPKLG